MLVWKVYVGSEEYVRNALAKDAQAWNEILTPLLIFLAIIVFCVIVAKIINSLKEDDSKKETDNASSSNTFGTRTFGIFGGIVIAIIGFILLLSS